MKMRKTNVQKMMFRMAKIQQRIKETKQKAKIEFATEIESLLQKKENVTIEQIREIYSKIKEKYGL